MVFWGVELKAGKKTPYVPPPEMMKLHVSMATLGKNAKPNERVFVECTADGMEDEGKPIPLCVLTAGKQENCQLDLLFSSYAEFTLSGSSTTSVYLSGYYTPEFEGGGDMGSDDDDEEDDSEDSDEEVDPNMPADWIHAKKMYMDMLNQNALHGDDDSEDDSEDDDYSEDEQAETKKSGFTIKQLEDDEDDDEEESEEEDEPVQVGQKRGKQLTLKEAKKAKKEEPAKTPVKKEAPIAKKETPSAKKETPSTKKETPSAKKETPPASAKYNPLVATKKEEPPKTPTAKKPETPKAAKKEPNSPKPVTPSKPSVKKYPNGLEVHSLEMGKPEAKEAAPGKRVVMNYTGKLQQGGKVFDSTKGKKAFEFRLGVGEVIKGWDVGVKGMRVGDKRQLVIPPSMGYGREGVRGAIPPNATLVFDIELVNVK